MTKVCSSKPKKKRGPPRSAVTILHVNQHVIRRNKKEGRNDPPLTIKQRGVNVRAHNARIYGPSTLVHRPDNPLSCGARVWIETHMPVVCDDPMNEYPACPDLTLSVYLVPHGLQADLSNDQGEVQSMCRDFGGNHKTADMRDHLISKLAATLREFIDNPVPKPEPKPKPKAAKRKLSRVR